MFHPDKPPPESASLFPGREVVQSYLEDFANEFHLTGHIQFKTKVEHIRAPYVKYIQDDKEKIEKFDWIIICSGHHDVPFIPKWQGMNMYHGKIIHSQTFDNANDFAGKKVLVIGSKSSGQDIG